MRRPLAAVTLVLLLVTAGCAGVELDARPAPGTSGPGVSVTVVDVVDGDTVEIEYRNGTRDTARLLGVDTPEVHVENDPDEFEGVPSTDEGRSCLRTWGERASGFARDHLLGDTVRIRFDANEPRRGSYDRLLVYIRDDGRLFNRLLVKRGFARVYDSEFTKRAGFYDLESSAQDERRGLWACRDPSSVTVTDTPTASGSGPLRVAEIHADAPGNDNENLNDEYVVFENRGEETLDLSGYRVEDEAGHVYRFPDGFALAPGERVTLHTGSGTDSDTDLYWGSDSALWNNGGDTVLVYAENGSLVVERSY